jgi:hypothetical protein
LLTSKEQEWSWRPGPIKCLYFLFFKFFNGPQLDIFIVYSMTYWNQYTITELLISIFSISHTYHQNHTPFEQLLAWRWMTPRLARTRRHKTLVQCGGECKLYSHYRTL